jgi:hypothetical protein
MHKEDMRKHREISITLDENDWGQIIDCLTCRAKDYESTAKYYETGLAYDDILDVNNAREAHNLAEWYRELVYKLRRQIEAKQLDLGKMVNWYDLPYSTYLEIVDDLLELIIGRTSNQEDLKFIADMQEDNEDPRQTASEIVTSRKCCSCDTPKNQSPDENG